MTPTTRDSLLVSIRDVENREAWGEFVAIYEPTIYRLLRTAGLQDADANDLTQEILIKVNQQVQRWTEAHRQGSFRGWLKSVARNLFISWQRQRKRSPWNHSVIDPQLLDEGLQPQENETVEFDNEAERLLCRFALKRVQEEVHESTWLAFHRIVFEELSIEQTAESLKMTAGAVRVAKCRVQARLKKVIEELRHEYL